MNKRAGMVRGLSCEEFPLATSDAATPDLAARSLAADRTALDLRFYIQSALLNAEV
jgi:hypothetical protein